jgi:hypothetical protein
MSDCSYDCSRHPRELQPNADISGIGVSDIRLRKSLIQPNVVFEVALGYTITAAMAVLVIVAYYVFNYPPDADPFVDPGERLTGQGHVPFRPNPIDVLILKFVRRGRLEPPIVDREVQSVPSRLERSLTSVCTCLHQPCF